MSSLTHPMALGATFTHSSINSDIGEAPLVLVSSAMRHRHRWSMTHKITTYGVTITHGF
ncbi:MULTISPECIES: glutamate--cysteine ligase [Photobacterium]|uniref:glutamate--cysteine ligase n=1 Tax=Photobacterium TaxID=657 RepID=UPI0013E287C5|nr:MULTISPECIES: glutamate--cysteine ligase [Photobacterium]MCD9488497.1 hypothetical protein [Photobacterium iliopiscarium]MCD9513723.1 hypothetical protein [Photobacterium carnosum]MCD9524853.1 hypothetical protein [Photobacterium carnosum]MCD9528652.1 hypothetical protein [Photobacterium carnosum]MCD9536488.1 hypothetical protein [Photobacterium carnosum]